MRCDACEEEMGWPDPGREVLRALLTDRDVDMGPDFTDEERIGEATPEQVEMWDAERWGEP